MPIYEYECCRCGVVEAMQGINDKPLTTCPKCGKRRVKKLISESSFQLKGSGWYVTDYGKGNGNGKHGKKDKAEPCSTETSSSEKPAETKPAKTTESKPKAVASSASTHAN